MKKELIIKKKNEIDAMLGGSRRVKKVLGWLFAIGCAMTILTALVFHDDPGIVRTFLYIDLPIIVLWTLDYLFDWIDEDRRKQKRQDGS